MRYSLINRVRGIFLGAFLGECLAKKQSHPSCDLGKMTVLGTESLITLGKLDVDDWLKRQETASLHFQNTTAWGEIILATLPVCIFSHESNLKLRENLLELLEIWDVDPVIRDIALVVGLAIAQSLTETLDPSTLIPQTISFLGNTSTSIPEQLSEVNILLRHRARLTKSPIELLDPSNLNITLIIYYFLSTPNDFSLTLLRTTHYRNPTTRAIIGALSGAYNSTLGIPVNWQVSFSPTNSPAWGLSSFSQMLELGDALLAVWAGVYNLYRNKSTLASEGYTPLLGQAPVSLFSAPRVIRPR
jgi:hypothetical protein